MGRNGPPEIQSARADPIARQQYNEYCGVRKGFRSSRDAWPTPHPEKDRNTSRRPCLFLISRPRPVGRAGAPVAGPAGKPLEFRVVGHPLEDPAEIATIVGRQTEFGIVGHDFGQTIKCLSRHDAALEVAAFGPRVGKEDEYSIDRSGRQRRDQQPRVIGKDPNVVEMPLLDLSEQFGYSVLKNLRADEADFGVMFGLEREMLTAAKADLEPCRGSHGAEQTRGVEPSGWRNAHRKPWQQSTD
jgi:hypothetical protein